MNQTLPLFPLNTVLFPDMPIRLHVFEERYKLMVNDCLEANSPFGVVLIQSGAEVQGQGVSAQPYAVGCTAMITETQPVGMGRMNIIAIGQDRFVIRSVKRDKAYLVGSVEYLPRLEWADNTPFDEFQHLRPWFEKYLQILARTENLQIDKRQLPRDPIPFAYLAASLIKIPLPKKQDFLVMDSAARLLETVTDLYRKEVTLTQMMLAYHPANEGTFSTN